MAKKKAKKKSDVRRQKAPQPAPRHRHTVKDTAIAAFIKEHKTTIGLQLTASDRAVIAAMTSEQIEKTTALIRLAWAKGIRYGGYNDSKRR